MRLVHTRRVKTPGIVFALAFALGSIPGPTRAIGGDADDPSPRSVGPVMTTATRGDRGVMEIPAHATVIDREEIERSGAESVPQLLRRQAGISVTNTTANPSFVTVESRGFNNGGTAGSAMLVLVDGRRANEADSGITEWAFVDIDDVESIEIVRGPASAVWGDNAVGGVIQIKTRAPDGRPTLALRGSGGSYSTGRGSIRASGREGPVFLQLFGSGYTSDSYRDRSAYDAHQFQGRAEVDLGDRATLGIEGGLAADDRNFPGALFVEPVDEQSLLGRRAAAPGVLEDGAAVNTNFVQGWVDALVTDDVRVELLAWWNKRLDDTTITSRTFGTSTIDFDKFSVGADLQAQVDVPLGEFANRLIVGGQFLTDDTDRDIVSSLGPLLTQNRRHLYSAFLQDEFSVTPDVLLSAGFRYDHADYRIQLSDGTSDNVDHPDWGIWSPKAALTWRIAEPVAAYVSYSRGFRFPNFDETSPFTPSSVVPDLEPQESDAFEVGFKLQTERVQGALTFYTMNVRNELIFNPDTFENENFDRTRHRGIETSITAQVCDWLQIYGAYTFDDAVILEHDYQVTLFPPPDFLPVTEARRIDDERIPINPVHRGTVGLFLDLPAWFELNWALNVTGKRRRANDFFHQAKDLRSYYTQDVFVAWKPPLGEHLEAALTFAIRNIHDERYEDFGALSTIFPPPDFLATPAQSVNPLPTRNWEIGLVLKFKL